MFKSFLEKFRERTIWQDEAGNTATYGDVLTLANRLGEAWSGRKLVFAEVDNTIASLSHYVALLSAGHVVFPYNPADADKALALAEIYRPNLIGRTEDGVYGLHIFDAAPIALHPDLAVLLSTSGSTGTPKFVKLSQTNLISNAESIAEYLRITGDSIEITTLKPSYSYGLSIVHSYLVSGARLILTDRSVMDSEFWALLARTGAKSFSGVPYTYEMILSQRIDLKDYPSLEYLTQAGGKLAEDKVAVMAGACNALGKRFYVMYGQTEAAPRIAYVPPEKVADFPTCIGVPVPGGRLIIRDEDGREITEPGVQGEIFYAGPNVMMGYALEPADLASNETPNELATGDLGAVNEHGLYYIAGRRSRFLKLFGNRISLDQIQQHFQSREMEVVCTGDDTCLVAVTTVPEDRKAAVEQALQDEFHIPPHAFAVVHTDAIPRLSNGKYDFATLRTFMDKVERKGADPLEHDLIRLQQEPSPIRRTVGMTGIFLREFVSNWLNVYSIQDESFASIRDIFLSGSRSKDIGDQTAYAQVAGDSLSYVQTSLAVSEYLGFLPDNWDQLSVAELESLKYDTPV